jgi:hypothetical protein
MFCVKNGKYVAVQGTGIIGTKEEPQLLPQGGNVQRDNVAVEFAVLPAKSMIEFVQNVGDTLMDCVNALPDDVDVAIVPSANFPKEELTHKECEEFGCDPDYNAWTMKRNEPPVDAALSTFRSCGGHIHIGFIAPSNNTFLNDEEGKAMTVRIMDVLLGLVATILDRSDEAIARRNLYGKAGCYRSTDYGIEYRTLSNFWIKSPTLVELMYSLAKDALKIMRDNRAFEVIDDLGAKIIQDTITNGDVEMAEDMVNCYVVDHMSKYSSDLFYELYAHGIDDINYKEEWKEVA